MCFAVALQAASSNEAGDSIKVVDKTFLGAKKAPGSTKLSAIVIKVEVEAVLKSRRSATLRAGATLENEREIITLFTRTIKEGKTAAEIPLSISEPKGKTLVVVVWIDPNPEETKGPPKPIVFEKFGYDLTSI